MITFADVKNWFNSVKQGLTPTGLQLPPEIKTQEEELYDIQEGNFTALQQARHSIEFFMEIVDERFSPPGQDTNGHPQ